MSIATFDELLRNSPTLREDTVKLAKSLASKNLFLSHSLSDLQPAKDALALLESHGATVYLDLEDIGIRSASPDVAQRLRKAIETCRRLVVIVTENTQTSRWIPWEVGLCDAFAGTERVALFPLRPSASASELWIRQEYFDLYPRIERHTASYGTQTEWAVRNPNGHYSPLAAWLSQTKPSPLR
ncbi:MAG: toll/interleukin-1 receptor domain-containing protein [Kofleriaceae bacterium]|nr:toll/interleukin-1 receptor domain-containing protein [Kofleriaceae bacterium]MBP9169858.1 toll/interleukin-1 receptor domain-containing protein [Kofleriaceae bacterium]MBP9858051.1 toll/interleukin-1 receptor domain-containing protein [Kofleriaceae bacterium]